MATFAEMAQTFASLFITWGVLGDALAPAPGGGGRGAAGDGGDINRSVEQAPAPRAPDRRERYAAALRLAASAMRVAASRLIPIIECCGFTPRFVGNTLESMT